MWDRSESDRTSKAAIAAISGLAVALITALVILPVTATAAKPKPLGFYVDKYMTLQVNESPNSINNFEGNCTASAHPAYTFAVIPLHGIPVKRNGKFKWSGQNSVNTPDGGTLDQTSLVTISGKFTSSKKVSGSYQLHKGGCKKIKFKAKLLKN